MSNRRKERRWPSRYQIAVLAEDDQLLVGSLWLPPRIDGRVLTFEALLPLADLDTSDTQENLAHDFGQAAQ